MPTRQRGYQTEQTRRRAEHGGQTCLGSTRCAIALAACGLCGQNVRDQDPVRAATLRKARGGRINTRLKGLTVAVEPPINADPKAFQPKFLATLNAALTALAAGRTPFRLVEGFRTKDRQQWLYGAGRPSAVPDGRPGSILTYADGVAKLSRHQGDGSPGSGKAADCYPTKNGSVYLPPSTDPVWTACAAAVEEQGLVAGHHFPTWPARSTRYPSGPTACSTASRISPDFTSAFIAL